MKIFYSFILLRTDMCPYRHPLCPFSQIARFRNSRNQSCASRGSRIVMPIPLSSSNPAANCWTEYVLLNGVLRSRYCKSLILCFMHGYLSHGCCFFYGGYMIQIQHRGQCETSLFVANNNRKGMFVWPPNTAAPAPYLRLQAT